MRSKFEEKVAKWLRDHKIKYEYEIKDFEYLQNIPNAKCGDCGSKYVQKIRKYLPDFFILADNGDVKFLLEAKGKFDKEERQKLLAIVAMSPYQVRMVLMRDNKINKGSETYYMDWMKKNKIQACVFPNIPERWFK